MFYVSDLSKRPRPANSSELTRHSVIREKRLFTKPVIDCPSIHVISQQLRSCFWVFFCVCVRVEWNISIEIAQCENISCLFVSIWAHEPKNKRMDLEFSTKMWGTCIHGVDVKIPAHKKNRSAGWKQLATGMLPHEAQSPVRLISIFHSVKTNAYERGPSGGSWSRNMI